MSLSTPRLHTFADRALDWLVHHLDCFDPFIDGIFMDKATLLRFKAMLELAWLCMNHGHCENGRQDRYVQKFLSFLQEVAQCPAYQQKFVRHPEQFFRFNSHMYASLLRSGIVDCSLYESVQHGLNESYEERFIPSQRDILFRDVQVMRELELSYMLDCGGFQHKLPSPTQIYQETILARMPPLADLTNHDVYNITHILFYMTDFGSRPVDALYGEQLPAIHEVIRKLLERYVDERNWDLAAEILIDCCCLHWWPSDIFEHVWDALLDAQLPEGFVPRQFFSQEKKRRLHEHEQRKYCFDQGYHPTLVSILAAWLTLANEGKEVQREEDEEA